MTEKLYYRDSYQIEFEAKVIETKTDAAGVAVALDQTHFYPTSGGQLHDTGWLNDIRVVDVIPEGQYLWHYLEKPLQGSHVHGKIDWERRFDFMQQHTAFHTLAQSFLRVLGAETLSSHLGEQISTIDIALDRCSWDQIELVERTANQVVWENRPVRSFYAIEADLHNPLLRKSSEAFDRIRLVEIDDYDLDPCGGTHVNSTGQIGLIKMLSSEKVRNSLRLVFVAGRRALQEFIREFSLLRTLSIKLTTGFDDIPAAIGKILEEQKRLYKIASSYEKLQAESSIADLLKAADNNPVISHVFTGLRMDTLRSIASAVIKKSQGIFLLGTQDVVPGLVFACQRTEVDLRPAFQEALVIIEGKGGGSPGFLQGSGVNGQQLDAALEKARQVILR